MDSRVVAKFDENRPLCISCQNVDLVWRPKSGCTQWRIQACHCPLPSPRPPLEPARVPNLVRIGCGLAELFAKEIGVFVLTPTKRCMLLVSSRIDHGCLKIYKPFSAGKHLNIRIFHGSTLWCIFISKI